MRAAVLPIMALVLPAAVVAAPQRAVPRVDVAAAAARGVAAVNASVPSRPNLPSGFSMDRPSPDPNAPAIADELIPPVPYTAQTVAFVKTFVVTATYDGKPYRIEVVVVDSQGLIYSTSQQGSRRVRDPESGDLLDVTVTGLSPVVFDVAVRKADAKASATRDRVAVGDLEQGHSAFALRDDKLAVEVERLDDEIDLR